MVNEPGGWAGSWRRAATRRPQAPTGEPAPAFQTGGRKGSARSLRGAPVLGPVRFAVRRLGPVTGRPSRAPGTWRLGARVGEPHLSCDPSIHTRNRSARTGVTGRVLKRPERWRTEAATPAVTGRVLKRPERWRNRSGYPAPLNGLPLRGLPQGAQTHETIDHAAQAGARTKEGGDQVRPTHRDDSPIEAADDQRHGGENVELLHGNDSISCEFVQLVSNNVRG